jgi:hypothetical protein
LVNPERGIATPSTWFPFGYVDGLLAANPQAVHLDGAWTSSDGRWRLEIKRGRYTWIERNASGQEHRRDAVLMRRPGDRPVFRIERANDAAYLAFAGARSSVIPAILAAGPQPSFMDLSRPSAEALDASWNGLRWTLDAQNRLTGIQQPGTSPRALSLSRV